MTHDLTQLIAASVAKVEAMTPEERQAMWRAQRASFIQAEAAFGSDAEEAEHRAALNSGDPERIAAAKGREEARLALAEAYIKEMGYDA